MEAAVVGLLVGKIADIIENETSLIGGVRDELEELKLELRSMHSFIQDAQTMYHLNAVDRDWVASVIDMCHPVETIIDNFMYHMNKQVNKTNFIYKIFHAPKNLLVRRRVAKKIQGINRKLKSIPERRQRYRIDGFTISQDDQIISDKKQPESLGYTNTGKVSLYAGQSLLNHEQLIVGANSLRMQRDGNLVLREHDDIIWSSGTAGKGNKCYVIMQSDGNLVIYDEHRAVWASNTVYGDDKYEFILQKDRNMVIHKGSVRTVIWASNTRKLGYRNEGFTVSQDDQIFDKKQPESLGYSDTGKVSLYAGQSLLNHEQLTVGASSLRMQRDGNLVLREQGDIIWSTGTAGKGNKCYVIMQSDGNLVIYDEHRAVWASNTVYGDDKYEFILQEDRNMVIYKGSERTVIWASNTHKFGV